MLGVFSYPFLESSPAPNVGLYSFNPFQDCFSFFFFQPQNKPVSTCRGLGKKEGGPSMASSWGSSCVVFKKQYLLYLTVLGPLCWAWAFCSRFRRASHCRAWALGLERVSGGSTGLSCFLSCWDLPGPGIKPLSPA